jgi:hypothetical protein
MMIRKSCLRAMVGFVCVAGLLVAGCDQYRTTELQRNYQVGLLQSHDMKIIESAIELSLAKRGWAILQHTGQRYVAELHERVHTVQVAVVYDAQSAHIDYVSSTNLQYEKNATGETIHRKYTTWVKNLADDIRLNVTRANATGGTRTEAVGAQI